eukprot:4983329-Alexandrium_andersonii.AAC.1
MVYTSSLRGRRPSSKRGRFTPRASKRYSWSVTFRPKPPHPTASSVLAPKMKPRQSLSPAANTSKRTNATIGP